MQSISSVRSFRILTIILPVFALAACGQGDGKEPILGTPAPPPPPPPPASCNDAITFEDACPAVTFTEFEGGVASIVDNPEQGTSNPSAKVGQMQKFAATSGATFGGSTLTLPTPLTVASGSSFTMKVWSQRSVQVLFQPEPQGPGSGIEITHGGSGWEELTFSLPGLSGSVTGITLIFDNGTLGAAAADPTNWTFYFDDITLVPPGGGGGGGTFSAITFDDAVTTYTLAGFGGAEDSSLQNDPTGGTNQVVQVNRAAGAETFAGTTVSTEANAAVPTIPLDASNTRMTVRVYSPAAGIPVRLKIEDASNPGVSVETEATTTAANTWETLSFDFANEAAGTAAFNAAATYNKVTIFFNFGAAGAPAETYFFDDIDVAAGGGGGGGSFSAITFDDAGTTYTLTGFGGAEDASVQTDPADGANQVVQVNRAAGAETFAGTTVSTEANNAVPAIPLDAANTEMTVRVYSPAAGVPVRLKIEDASDPSISVETEAATTVANTWETLTFDFANEVSGTTAFNAAATYNKITIFFNFGTAGAPAETYFFDDIDVAAGGGGGGGGGSADIDFETAATGAGFTWTVFENDDNPPVQIVANPDQSGANTSATVAQVTARVGGQAFAGAETAHGDIGPLTLDSTNSTVTIMVWKSVISDVGLKFAIANGGAQGEIKVANTLVNQWEELTFDFSGNIGLFESTNIDQLIVFPDFDLGGRTQDNIVYFDNISFTDGNGGGGGGAPASTDFEGVGPFVFSDFGGGVATVVANPDATGINASAMVGRMQKFAGDTFGGSTLDLGAAIDFSAGEIYSVKVWSQRAVPVLLKLEGLNQERTANHTGSGWEVLCFDFSGTTVGAPATAITLIFDNGTAGDAQNDAANWTFYFDDIEQTSSCGGGGNVSDLVDFEDTGGPYIFSDFEGGAATVENNPDATGINTSARVAQMLKFVGQTFGGSTLTLPAPVDVPADSTFTMKVWSQRAVPVLFKLEGGPVGEITANHGGSGWEELSFDFSGISGNGVTGITFIFDNGVNGAAATDPTNWTFYFDDIAITSGGGGGGGSGVAAIDFEPAGIGTGFTWTVFENADNPPVQIIANPDPSGANTSANVAQVTARVGGQPFAGAETAHGDIGPLTLDATNSTVTIMVWKTVISDVGLKFAIANGGAQPEIKVANTLVNQWEELSFDFSGNIGLFEAIDIDQLIVFPDFDLGGRAQDNIVYFDNINFTDGSGSGGPTATLMSDFEDAGAPYTFADFEGGAATVIDNPQVNGTGTSPKVGQMQKFAGQTFGGSTFTLPSTVNVPAGTSFTMKVWSQRAVPVLFKLEGGPVGEITANHGGTGWEELSFDFTGITGNGVTAITLIFDNGVNGAAATDPTNWTFYFDDMTIVTP